MTRPRCHGFLVFVSCDDIVVRGDPPEVYALPKGWVRFAIHLSFDEQSKFNKWQVSFHGTTMSNVVGIARERQLKVPDNKTVHIREGHIPDQFYFFTSPSILYASFGLYASPFLVGFIFCLASTVCIQTRSCCLSRFRGKRLTE
jgi:hypothetical protein